MKSKKAAYRDGEEKKRMREVLRTLDRIKAPWYFDAALEQRLHQGGTAPGMNRRLTFALAGGIVLILLAGFLYLSGGFDAVSGLIRPFLGPSTDAVVKDTSRNMAPADTPVVAPVQPPSFRSQRVIAPQEARDVPVPTSRMEQTPAAEDSTPADTNAATDDSANVR